MRYIILLVLLSTLTTLTTKSVTADSKESARKELFQLLENRKEVFENYNTSLKKKSGFFGNRTKNDMRQSHSTLQDIIEMDNKIMNSLNRVIDTKNYEKTSMTFDAGSNQDRIANLTKVNDAMLTQNEILTLEKKQLNTQILKMKFYFIVLFLIIGGLLINLFKTKVVSKQ